MIPHMNKIRPQLSDDFIKRGLFKWFEIAFLSINITVR